MAQGKKSFILYTDIIHTVNSLTNDEAGKLFKHILDYVNDKNPQTDDRILQLAFEPIKQALKRDLNKWIDAAPVRSERAKNAGIASGKARRTKGTKSNLQVQNELNELNEPVIVSVNVIDSVSVNIPAIEEFVKYGVENSNKDFEYALRLKYNSWVENGWVDGNGKKILKWKSKLLNTIPHLVPQKTEVNSVGMGKSLNNYGD